jgi:hypothetical protein
MDLSGIWKSNDGGVYFVRQIGTEVWWQGETADHEWVNAFKGTCTEDTVTGEWIDLPKGKASSSGELNLNIQGNKMTCTSSGGNFPSREWKKENVITLFSNLFASQSEFLNAGFSLESNLTGGWFGNDGGFYYIREIDETVWIFGEHPKRNWANLFKGTKSGNTISGEWVDLPKGKTAGKGTLELEVGTPSRSLRRLNESGNYPSSALFKVIGDYAPGEAGFDSDFHPDCWSIKWDNKLGLNCAAYDSVIRSPYIQNVTTTSATVLWRVSIPSGTNPADILSTLKAEAYIAPLDTPIANGKKYSIQNGIMASEVAWTYQYQSGAFDMSTPVKVVTKDNLNLHNLNSRPIIEFKVRFSDLDPGTVYHYRIKSDTTQPASGLNEENTKYFTLVNDAFFRTAQSPLQNNPIRFLAMGDFGPGNDHPNYCYDVFDLFHDVARNYSPDLWLALGDLESTTGGHPNALDPFFFNLYNAHHDHNFGKPPRWTSTLSYKAKETTVKAFQKPPYFGVLGGLPVYPTFGDHDLGLKKPSLEQWRKSYLGNFELPTDGFFNQAGKGFFYTFRYGNVIFISLGIPSTYCKVGNAESDWRAEWGDRQKSYLQTFLNSIKNESDAPDVWVVAFFHDYHWGYSLETKEQQSFAKFLASSGVDVVLMGHQHSFAHKTIKQGEFDYRAIVVGTGGYGDSSWHGSSGCQRPGFLMASVYGDTFEYWKLDTHSSKKPNQPLDRNKIAPVVREYCAVKKLSFGKHEVKEMDLGTPYHF